MKKHILLIDDEEAIRNLLGEWLTINGFQTTAVSSSAEAIRTAQQTAFDLIIADLQLEDADGLEMIAQLKKALPTTPVILLTGMLFDAEVIRRIQSEHGASYIEKTASLAKILDAVRRLTQEAGGA